MNQNYFIKNLIFIFLWLVCTLISSYFKLPVELAFLTLLLFWLVSEIIYYRHFFTIDENSKNDIFEIKENLPFTYLVLNKGRVIFTSESFRKKFLSDAKSNINIYDLVKEYESGVKRQKISILNSTYILYSQKVFYQGKDCELVFFVESLYGTNEIINDVEPIIVSLILIDNYDGVVESTEKEMFPLLMAKVDQIINDLSLEIGGILQKFEKDKYLLIFTRDKLDFLKETKFDVLNKIRSLEISNKFPVTLSIGIGFENHSLPRAMDYARQSLDLALGRGGDQVLIKDSEKFYFYGGNSKEIDSTNRVRARVKSNALSDLINEASDIIIMGHRLPDLDCLGSAIGVNVIARSFGKKTKIILNKLTSSIDILYNRLTQEKEYADVFISSEEALSFINPNSLLIIVDTHRPSIVESSEILEIAKNIVVFDHHRKAADFISNPVLVYHEPYASSTSELITEMLLYIRNKYTLLPVEADALLAGITVDTKNFAFKTGSKTFEAAAFLRRRGADSMRVRLLFQYKIDDYLAKSNAVTSAEIYNGNLAIAICPPASDNPNLVTSQSADDLLNIYGITASFVLCNDSEHVLISARSFGSMNVQVIMEKLGGGGHQTVAGAQLIGIDIKKAIEMLKKAIDEYNQEVKNL